MSSATRILVVEDEGLVAQDLKCTLEDLGYVVPAIAATGEAAISKAAEAGPDLVLMDIVLKGGMDGVTATEQISAAYDIPVVYVTAHASEETLQRAKISEPFGYVLKPFEERELHSVIEMALQKHRMQRALKEAHDVLEMRVAERTAELAAANASLKQEIADHKQVVKALQKSETKRKQAEQALWDKEAQLLAAQKIQEQLLPQAAPVLPGFDIAGALVPAEFAAGDYFDYLAMPDGSVGVVIGDVAGHGFAPALIMASTHVLLRSLAETHTDVGEILTLANSTLLRETEEQRFVTILFVRLDPRTGSLVHASAGHPAGYVLDGAGKIKACLESTGLPLAILADAKSAISGPVMLEPGDTILLVTDGISEARSPAGDFFGAERMLEIVCANRDRNACEIVEGLFTAIRDFSKRGTPVDDTTAVVIKVTR